MKSFLKLLLGLFLFSESLNAQQIKLIQTMNGKVVLKPTFTEIKANPHYFLTNILDNFTGGELNYALLKPDSVELVYKYNNYRDSIKANIHNVSFQYYDDENHKGLNLGTFKHPEFKEKYVKTGDSFLYTTTHYYSTGCATGGFVHHTDVSPNHVKTLRNKIIQINSGVIIKYTKKGAIESIKIYSAGGNRLERQFMYQYDKKGNLVEFTCSDTFFKFRERNFRINYYYEDGHIAFKTRTPFDRTPLSKAQLDSLNNFNKTYLKLSDEYLKAEEDENTGEEKLEKLEYEADTFMTLLENFVERANLPEESDEVIFKYIYKNKKLIAINTITDDLDIDEKIFTKMDSFIYDTKGRIIKYIHYNTMDENDFERIAEYQYDQKTGKLIYKKAHPIGEESYYNQSFEEWYEYDKKGRIKTIVIDGDTGKPKSELHLKYLD